MLLLAVMDLSREAGRADTRPGVAMPARWFSKVPAPNVLLMQAKLERPMALKGGIEPDLQFANPHGFNFDRAPIAIATNGKRLPDHPPKPTTRPSGHHLLGRHEAVDVSTR